MKRVRTATILVVDDYPDVVRLLEGVLEREHRVVTAFGGQEALRQAEEQGPDMIVLDLSMPDLDGLRVLSRLRACVATRSIPVILLTARGEAHDVALGLSLGADYYMPKPFNPLDVAKLIRHHFRAACA